MRALVTGSAGFVGSHLVQALIARGYRVTGVDRDPGGPFSGTQKHYVLDLADSRWRPLMSELARDSDIVFHLAAKAGVRGGGEVLEAMRIQDNVVATRNLLAAVPQSVPLVVTSSSSVYGGSIEGVASREDDPLRPRGGYARSKSAMEYLCEQRRAGGGVTAVMRPFTVAGERQRPDMAFSLWLRALERGEPIRIFGSETRSRDITDVRHVVRGLIQAGERSVNTTVNLGTGAGHRLIDMAQTLMDVSGMTGDMVREPLSSEEPVATLADTTRCRQLLGFSPETDLPALLERQIRATVPHLAMAAT